MYQKIYLTVNRKLENITQYHQYIIDISVEMSLLKIYLYSCTFR